MADEDGAGNYVAPPLHVPSEPDAAPRDVVVVPVPVVVDVDVTVSPAPTKEVTADDLNAAELRRIDFRG